MVNWVPGVTIDGVIEACIMQALKFYRGNVQQTSRALNISDRTIYNKLKEYEDRDKLIADQSALDRTKRSQILDRMRGIKPSGMENQTAPTQPNVTPQLQTNSGIHIEPAPLPPPKPAVSLPIGQEIQSMSSKHASEGGKRGRR